MADPGEKGGRLNERRWTVLCGIGAAVLAIALSWDFFVLSLDPWPDQSWVLLAAERHHRGLGLTTVMDGSSDDLASTVYRRLVYFPPGYPLILSAMRSTGLSIETNVKIINAVALVLGFAGWMLLAGRVVPSRPARLIFSLVLVLACRGTIPKGGTTDYVLWAVLPFWILAVTEGTFQKRVRWLVMAAALAAFLIGFRWMAVVLVPAGCALVLLDWRGSPGKRLWAATVYGAIPTLTFAAISLINRSLSGRASTALSYIEPRLDFKLLASYYPIEGLFSRPLALEPFLARLWRALDPTMSPGMLELFVRLLIPMSLAAMVLLVTDRNRLVVVDSTRLFWHVVAIVYTCLVGLLAFMTVRYNWTGVAWTYLEEPRYFLPFFPAIALFWFAAGENIRSRAIRRTWLVLLSLAVIYVGQAEIRWSLKRARAGEADLSILAQLRVIAHDQEHRNVVFDIDISRYLLWDGDQFSPRQYPDETSSAQLRASRPVDVWIVERVGERNAYATDPQYDQKRLDALLRRFHPKLSWTSSDGHFRLYHAPSGSF